MRVYLHGTEHAVPPDRGEVLLPIAGGIRASDYGRTAVVPAWQSQVVPVEVRVPPLSRPGL